VPVEAEQDLAARGLDGAVQGGRNGTLVIIHDAHAQLGEIALESSDDLSGAVCGKPIGNHNFHPGAWIGLLVQSLQQ
jgi:hypothetical protein